jgi:hypothetical protein
MLNERKNLCPIHRGMIAMSGRHVAPQQTMAQDQSSNRWEENKRWRLCGDGESGDGRRSCFWAFWWFSLFDLARLRQ